MEKRVGCELRQAGVRISEKLGEPEEAAPGNK
jgi:hypothetical protein